MGSRGQKTEDRERNNCRFIICRPEGSFIMQSILEYANICETSTIVRYNLGN